LESLNNLANALRTRFEQLGDLDSLAEAINLHRQALALRPSRHPQRSRSLHNLANAVMTRFDFGNIEFLAEAIELHHQTVDLHPPGRPHRPTSLDNLAVAMLTRFNQLGDLESLTGAIELLHH
jgi:hypothetical protein